MTVQPLRTWRHAIQHWNPSLQPSTAQLPFHTLQVWGRDHSSDKRLASNFFPTSPSSHRELSNLAFCSTFAGGCQGWYTIDGSDRNFSCLRSVVSSYPISVRGRLPSEVVASPGFFVAANATIPDLVGFSITAGSFLETSSLPWEFICVSPC